MRNKAVMLLVLVIALATFMPAAGAAPAPKFKDVNDNFWAREEIDYLSSKGIINGYKDGTFGINGTITRAEAASLVMRALGWGDLSNQPDPGYPDVPSRHWAYYSIAAMRNAGIFAPEGNFYPDRKLTRAEMAEILVNTFDLSSTSGTKFTDVTRDHPSYDAIQILAGNQITVGYSDGTFRPEQPVTRTEFAVFTARALDESFRPPVPDNRQGVQVIYDIEIGDVYVQLDNPLLLTDHWRAPVELFQRMGYQVETISSNEVVITTDEGVMFSMKEGQTEVWIGQTSVNVSQAVKEMDGQPYIEAGAVLRTLKKPLVYYPEQRLVRIEAPRITAADIKQQAPDAIVGLIHEEQPYWQWTKTDSDYLEYMRRNGTVESNRAKLAKQMKELTEAFFRVEREKIVVRGLNYYSDHVTGKLDAISRGLEARYLLLNEQETYRYPEVGKSGALGSWRFTDTQFGYTVSDHSFDHLNERKQELVALIESLHDLPFEQFRGLNIYGAPFMIRDVLPDGTIEAFSGKAMGQDQMIVSGSIPSTFIHEFGHNWDAAYGNHEEYLSLRGRTGYKPTLNAWKDRVEENFAEDFTAIFLPDSYPRVHKAEFAEPSPEEAKALRDWIRQKEQEGGSLSAYRVELNGAAVVPSVIVSDDGKLQVSGEADRTVVGELFNVASGQIARIEIPANGSFESTIELPGKGIYQLLIGKFNSTIVYQ